MNKKAILYDDIVTPENLFAAWNTFRKGKKGRCDVQMFDRHLEDNIFALHKALKNQTYQHAPYKAFYVNDPKQRHIHKAGVKDRVVHQTLYSALYPIFDPTFIYDSYSCRLGKGTHKAVARLQMFLRKESRNYTRNCWVLKCDIKKFFATVDKDILLTLIKRKVEDDRVIWLIKSVLESFSQGLPLGNLTSQLFANVYLNELDQFVKHELKVKYYIRYCDDFILVHQDKKLLDSLQQKIAIFLSKKLYLKLHPRKIIYRKFSWGIDFLGYIVLPHYILPRTKTRQRVFEKLATKVNQLKNNTLTLDSFNQSLQSYLGYLKHARNYKIITRLKNYIYLSGVNKTYSFEQQLYNG